LFTEARLGRDRSGRGGFGRRNTLIVGGRGIESCGGGSIEDDVDGSIDVVFCHVECSDDFHVGEF